MHTSEPCLRDVHIGFDGKAEGREYPSSECRAAGEGKGLNYDWFGPEEVFLQFAP